MHSKGTTISFNSLSIGTEEDTAAAGRTPKNCFDSHPTTTRVQLLHTGPLEQELDTAKVSANKLRLSSFLEPAEVGCALNQSSL